MNIVRGTFLKRRVAFFVRRSLRRFHHSEPLQMFSSSRSYASDCVGAVYIINLDRQPSRWLNFVGEARRQTAEGDLTLMDYCCRVSAIDGKLKVPSDAVMDVTASYPLESQYYVDPDPKLLPKIQEEAFIVKMTREEIAVAQSHVKAWERW